MKNTQGQQPAESAASSGSAVFPLGHVLSITTGRLCCDIGSVYEILNHITGDNLFTHVLPRACRFAAPLILQQHPSLGFAGTPEEMQRLDDALAAAKVPMEGIKAWMESVNLPSNLEIENHTDAWLSFDPVEELEGMVGNEKVIVINPQNAELRGGK